MICAHGTFIRDLEEIVSEAHLISDEFQSEICQAKYQIWNLVRQQIRNLQNRKKLDFTHCTPCQSVNYSMCEHVNACTEPCPELLSLSDEISRESFQTLASTAINLQNNANCPETIGREDAEFRNRLVTRSVTPFAVEQQNTSESRSNPSVNRWFQFSKKIGKLLTALAIGFLLWIALVYGILLGVSLCSNGSCLFTYTRRTPVL